MSAELHWFPVFVADWLASDAIALMLPEQEGAFFRLLLRAWGKGLGEPSLPADDATLAVLSRLEKRWAKLGPMIREQFEERDGRLFNTKLTAVWNEQQKKHKQAVVRGQNSAKARADKRETVSKLSMRETQQLESELEREEKTATASPRTAAARKPVAVPTWLSPYILAWKQRFDGPMPVEKNVTVLRALEKQYGADEVTRRWAIYLASTSSQYASASKLKAGWGEFGGGPTIVRPSAVSRGAVLLDLLARYDLFSYNGNRDEYEAKLARACDDPQAGPTFRDDVAAIKPTRGEIRGTNDHFKALEIEARLARVKVPA